MKLPLLRTALVVAGSLLPALGGLAAPPVPPLAADEILVTRVPDVPSGGEWSVTLPPGASATLMDQEWLVVDGQSEGFGGGFLPPDAADKPFKLYANDEMDEMIKLPSANPVPAEAHALICLGAIHRAFSPSRTTG